MVQTERFPCRPWVWLVGWVMLAIAVRLIAATGEPALAQSDGYAHLQLLTDWVTTGQLRHSYYPPGYYWMLGLPARLLGLDPYQVLRFGGAFFGGALVISLFMLARVTVGTRAALWTAFLVAGFPALRWLQRTGVGGFPSQSGLLLVPLILLCWDRYLKGRLAFATGLIALTGLLAVSVPMMLIDLFPLFLFDLVMRLGQRRSRGPILARAGVLALLGGMVLVLLIRWVGTGQVLYIFSTIAGVPRSGKPHGVLALDILVHYLSPMRWLPASGSAVALILATLPVLAWWMGRMTRGRTQVTVLLAWSMVASLQTIFGLFQFPLYWRAGWCFMMAWSVVAGALMATVLERLPVLWKRVAIGGCVLSLGLTLRHPPAPTPHLSAAEGDLVQVLRALVDWSEGRLPRTPQPWIEALTGPPIGVWSRRFNVFQAYFGDPVHAFLEDRPGIHLGSVADWKAGNGFDPRWMQLVLLDDLAPRAAPPGLMRWVNPDLAVAFEDLRQRLLREASRLRDAVEMARQSGWETKVFTTPQGLEVILLYYPDPAGKEALWPSG